MTDRDPAFLWETEAMRRSPQRAREGGRDPDSISGDGDTWVTLRQANRATGIPVETLRKWARRSSIPSYLSPSPSGGANVRMVDLAGVRRRAAELGRATQDAAQTSTVEEEPGGSPVSEPPVTEAMPPITAKTTTAAPEHPAALMEATVTPAVATKTSSAPIEPPAEAAEATSQPTGSLETPPGTMIVPVDAWNKMLMQLGNLHEAGQQLAEARERAAKAETEATFLRERLAEIRRADAAEETSANPLDAEPAPPPVAPQSPEKVWQYLVRRIRDRTA